MARYVFLFGLALFGFGSVIYAQLPYTFTQTAHINNVNITKGLTVDSSGTVFIGDGNILYAYVYDDTSFTNITHIVTGTTVNGIALGPNRTIFVANDYGGLKAYNYDGVSFTNTANIYDGGRAFDLAIGVDGSIFLANLDDGLRAYIYNDTSFTNTAHINSGGYAEDVAVRSDGTVFLANGFFLRAYSYNGVSFTNTANINNEGYVSDVAVVSDGTVFVAYGQTILPFWTGLKAYSYNGSSFTQTAQTTYTEGVDGIAIGPDNTVFAAIRQYWIYGLRAYIYNDTSFTNNAYIDVSNRPYAVAVSSDGTVFLAEGDSGLYAYTYSGYTAIENEPLKAPIGFTLFQNYPNPFNPSTTIEFSIPKAEFVTLKIYNILGEEVTTLVSKRLSAGKYKYDWDAGRLASGVYLYRLQTDQGFSQTRKLVLLK